MKRWAARGSRARLPSRQRWPTPSSPRPASACGACRCAWPEGASTMRTMRKTNRTLFLCAVLIGSAVSAVALAAASDQDRSQADAFQAFAVVQKVLQHPRCQNCHIPGDAPLQFDQGLPHRMNVLRGAEGNGPPGLACATCHQTKNL